MTLICVPIMVTEVDAALADAAEAKRLGSQIVEYRIDQVFSGAGASPDEFQDSEAGTTEEVAGGVEERVGGVGGGGMAFEVGEIERLVASSPLPCIVTCRPTFEGGFYDGDDASRISLYEHLGNLSDGGPRYVDVEWATFSRSANIRQKVKLGVDHPGQMRGLETGLILSMHDFERRPVDLTRRFLAMQGEPAAKVLKVAFRARSLRDNLELFDLMRQSEKPVIALGMGEFGMMSRVLAPKFGGFLTFASLREASATAPGQPTIEQLMGEYRFGSIGRATRVYGIVGCPVGHSMSPLVHNAGFQEVGHDGVYVPLPIVGDENDGSKAGEAGGQVGGGGGGDVSFKGTMLELIDHEGLDFAGASVTLPHKGHLVRLALEMIGTRGWQVSDAARAIGAANTLVIERDEAGRCVGARVENTDAPAIVACVREALSAGDGGSVGGGGLLQGKRIAVLGAGGVARGAAYALASAGAHVVIYAREVAKAETIARELQGASDGSGLKGTIVGAAWDARHGASADVFINCTPLGMKGGGGEGASPLDFETLAKGGGDVSRAVCFDTVYNPVRTCFLFEAERVGARTIDGVSMFVRQAAMQFEMWTGKPAPIARFDALVRQRLQG
jgi:3-dehydroquinate dehydratase/shikimate dehydrogenase